METYTIILGDLEFPQSDKGNLHWTGAVQGFGVGDIRTSSHINSGANGGYIGDQFTGFRRIPLDLVVQSRDLAQVEQLAMQVNAALKIGTDIPVRLVTPTGKQYVIPKARVIVAEPIIGDTIRMIDYKVELLAGDPTIYDYTSGDASRVLLQKLLDGGIDWASDGIDWDVDGFDWTDGVGDAIVQNLGNVDIAPLITITGIVHNPIIRNVTTGREISLNISTAAADKILIDFLNEEVTLNGVNIYNNLISDDFWRVEPGDNRISYVSSSNTDTAVVELEWFNGYSGVM